MMVGILAMMSFNPVDTWFVAQLGGASLAAMSFTFPVVILLISLGVGLMAGTSSVIARALGKGDHERVRSLTTHALILGLGLALICTVVGLLTLDPLFRPLGATDALIPLIRDYMTLWYTGFVFFLVPMVGMAAIRAAGDTRLQSTTMIGAALVNVVLDPLLIFGLAGLPRLELRGAAAATVLARLLSVGVCYWALRHKMHMLTFAHPRVSRVLDSWRAVLHVGFPAAGTNMIIPLSGGVDRRHENGALLFREPKGLTEGWEGNGENRLTTKEGVMTAEHFKHDCVDIARSEYASGRINRRGFMKICAWAGVAPALLGAGTAKAGPTRW